MTEKLKYKVGDKVLVEAEIIEVDNDNKETEFPYRVVIGKDDSSYNLWLQDELLIEPQQKPKITQAVMDWYESHKRSHWNVRDYFVHTPEEIDDWFSVNLQNEHAFVTLITYGPQAVEVEKEKKYLVTLKSTGQLLARTADGFFFGTNDPYFKDSQYEFTKQELIDAGFGSVFDNSMFEVEEVEE